ncbi:hypothetical protein ABFX02_02G180600 [Erythranthe guttata]
MNTEDQEHSHLRAGGRQHNQKRFTAMAAYKTLSTPKGYLVLIILSFILGYITHSQTQTQTQIPPDVSDLSEHNKFPNKCKHPVPSNHVRQTVLDRVFNGTSPFQGFPPPHITSLLWEDWAKGWGSNAPVFEHLINQVRPRVIVEVGTFLGASATHMVGLTRKLGLDTQIICIDDFRGWPGYYDEEKSLKMVNGDSLLMFQFMQNVVKANATDSILFLPFSASTALNGLCDWGVYGDLVEVDAAHDFHSAWVDINNAYKILRPGGVLFGHDYAWEGVRYAVHSFARLNGFQVKLDGEHWILY